MIELSYVEHFESFVIDDKRVAELNGNACGFNEEWRANFRGNLGVEGIGDSTTTRP